jgi:hypothetical protein
MSMEDDHYPHYAKNFSETTFLGLLKVHFQSALEVFIAD